MANFAGLIEWALARRANLNLRVRKLGYVDEWLPGLNDFIVTISLGEERFEGRSIADDPTVAVGKALVEAIERATAYACGFSSHGVAAHFSAELAQRNAKFELIERDAVLVHHLLRRPFSKLFVSLEDIFPGQKHHIPTRVQFSFFKAPLAVESVAVVICLAEISEASAAPKWLFGFGCDSSEILAARKSFLECVQNAPVVLANEYLNEPDLKSFETFTRWCARNHLFLGLDPNYINAIIPLFCESPAPLEEKTKDNPAISFSSSPLPVPLIFSGTDISVMRIYSGDLQDLFWGPTLTGALNWARLSSITSSQVRFDEIFNIPHFIG